MSAASSGVDLDPNYGSRFRDLCPSDFPDLASPKTKRSRQTNKPSSPLIGKPSFPFAQDAPTGFPEFFIIKHIEPNKDLKNASCFLINKAIEIHIGAGSITKRLRDGTLLTKVISKKQAQLITSLQTLGGIIDVEVKEHPTLNHSKGLIFCYDLKNLTEEEILDGLKGQRVTEVKKMNKKINGEWVGTGSVIVTFKASTIPTSLDVGFHHVQCKQYIPSPMRCLNCFKYGHPKKYCKSDRICPLCSKDYHEGECETGNKCTNCDENHSNWSKDCHRFKSEQEIQRIVAVDKISIIEARRKFRINFPNFAYPTYASAANGIAFVSRSNTHIDRKILNSNTHDLKTTQNAKSSPPSSSIPSTSTNPNVSQTKTYDNPFTVTTQPQTHTNIPPRTLSSSNLIQTTDPKALSSNSQSKPTDSQCVSALPSQYTQYQTDPTQNKIQSTINENLTQILRKNNSTDL